MDFMCSAREKSDGYIHTIGYSRYCELKTRRIDYCETKDSNVEGTALLSETVAML